jgi:hypothetical protein
MRAFLLTAAAAALIAGGALAHDQHGNPNWIANGRFISPIDGQHCCGVHDCFVLSDDDVKEVAGGVLVVSMNEVVPFKEVQISKDGRYWRCKKADGSRRCFFAPPPNV